MEKTFIDYLRTRCLPRAFKEGALIAREGEQCDRVGVIFSGRVLISTLTEKSEEFLIANKGPSEVFGELLVFSTSPVYAGTIRTGLPSLIGFFARDEWIKINLDFDQKAFLARIADQGLAFQRRAKVLSQATLSDRLLFFLKTEQERSGRKDYIFKTKEELARYLAMPRPSLSRIIITLEREKKIKATPHTLSLI